MVSFPPCFLWLPLEDTGFDVGEAIPVSRPPPPQLSSCIATQLSLYRETRAQYTSVHHGKWRGNQSQPPSQPHADHKETGALYYSLLAGIIQGSKRSRLWGTGWSFYSQYVQHPNTTFLPFCYPTPQGCLLSVHSMWVFCFSPSHMLSSNNDEWNWFPYGKTVFSLSYKDFMPD